MREERRARITWSAAQVRKGLPTFSQTLDPAWVEGTVPRRDEGWSLMCRVDAAPSEQGNPSMAHVRFLMPAAPHDALRPGATLRLFERETFDLAVVEILD